MSGAIRSGRAFQHQKLVQARMVLDHDGTARHGRRDAAGVNRYSVCLLWSLNKHCAIPQIQPSRPAIEIKCSMGREPHNRFIEKTQLSTRSVAGAHNSSLMDDIVYRG